MIAILDTNLGNLQSVYNALSSLGKKSEIVKYNEIKDTHTHLIIPGVGFFAHAMQQKNLSLAKKMISDFKESKRPILGICLGMQLMADYGEEGAGADGLRLIPGKVIKIPSENNLILPHMGWNTINFTTNHPIFKNVKNNIDCYFVHSYHFVPKDKKHILSKTHYGIDFASVIGNKNLIGFQFHPEKSQKNGLKLLENFCNWDGEC